MKLQSTYSLGEHVYYITSSRWPKNVMCNACAGFGTIELKDSSSIICPRCYGRGLITETWIDEYRVRDTPLTVGQVRIEISVTEYKEEYMMEETGVGSGSIYDVTDLFPSKVEAELECKRRNTAND